MICPECGAENGEGNNFCEKCGTKLKKTCSCWIKKGNYDCGKSSCPGYGLLVEEKVKDPKTSKKVHNQNQ